MVNHGAPRISPHGLPGLWWRLATLMDNAIMTGFITVDGFFVLSGFVLVYSYCDARGQTVVPVRAFWIARAARLLPIYLVALAIGVLLALVGQQAPLDVPGLARALTFTQAWWPPIVWNYNPPAWTLSVEAVFYLLFPFFARLLTRLNRTALFVALPLLWGIILLADCSYDRAWPFTGPLLSLVYHPVNFLPAFLMGMVLGRLYQQRNQAQTRAGLSVSKPDRMLLLASCGLLTVMVTAPWRDGMVYHGYLLPLWCVILYRVATGGSRLTCLLSRPLAVRLGEASYGMYLLHWPLFALVQQITHHGGNATLSLLPCIVWIILVIGVSLLAYRYIERPARRRIMLLQAARPVAPPQAETSPIGVRGLSTLGQSSSE